MDPATLATTVTSFLIPYLTKIGEHVAEDTGKKLWETIVDKFKGKPAATGAAEEFAQKTDDPDNKEAFTLQLKKALKDDPDFAEEIARLLDQGTNRGGITNTDGVVATDGSIAVRDVQVSGDMSGNIIIGPNNTISQETDTISRESTGNKKQRR